MVFTICYVGILGLKKVICIPPHTQENKISYVFNAAIIHPTIKTSTSQNLLLAIPYTMILSNFEQLQGQGNVIPASVGRDYLGTQGLGGGQWSVGPARELQWIYQSLFEDEAAMSAVNWRAF